MPVKLALLLILTAIFCPSCVTASGGGDDESRLREADRLALANAEKNIEKHRKGSAVIELRDFARKDVTIKVRQLTHSFKFGCYLKIDGLNPEQTETYENYFGRVFNYAVIGTFWDVTENRRGVHFWENFDKEVALAQRNGWRIQTAPILWGSNQAGTPKWLPKTRPELQNALDERVRRYFSKYPKVAEDVEIVNESLSPEPDVFLKRIDKAYVETAFRQARQSSPSSRLMINDYGVFGSVAVNNYNSDKYFELINELKTRQVPFDIVGIQSHANREWYSPSDVAAKLDRYAALGKPIQISEFSAQTKNYDDRATYERILGNYRSGTWDDEKQAEFYREFYTVAFGHPGVEAIVQWGLDDARAWLPGIGVIGENLKPKPNYVVLDELINNQWRTNLELSPKGANNTEFRGFFGVYDIEVLAGGKSLTKRTFELKKGEDNKFVIAAR